MLLVSIHAEIQNQSGGTQCYIAETHAPPCAPLLIAQSHRIDGAGSHHDAARVAVRRLVNGVLLGEREHRRLGEGTNGPADSKVC
jgi:hypothetical protein